MIIALEKDDGSVHLFNSAREVEAVFETIDVENGEYEFCDETGQRFVAEIVKPVGFFRAGSYRLHPTDSPNRELLSGLLARSCYVARGMSGIQNIDELRKAYGLNTEIPPSSDSLVRPRSTFWRCGSCRWAWLFLIPVLASLVGLPLQLQGDLPYKISTATYVLGILGWFFMFCGMYAQERQSKWSRLFYIFVTVILIGETGYRLWLGQSSFPFIIFNLIIIWIAIAFVRSCPPLRRKRSVDSP
jgi:hypothetical protein